MNIVGSQKNYIPILSVRPAEIIALRELPDVAKQNMLPFIILRPWLGSGTLDRAMRKVLHSYPRRPFVLEFDNSYKSVSSSEVDLEMAQLRESANGFSNWLNFVRRYEGAIPSVRFDDDFENLLHQIREIKDIDRGMVVRVEKGSFHRIENIDAALNAVNYFDVIYILDFGTTDQRFLVDQSIALSSIRKISAEISDPSIAISATSFPSDFIGLGVQKIYERSLFRAVSEGTNRSLIYSDRGSARLPRPGGGGIPAPRIDLPSRDTWEFHRKPLPSEASREERFEAYCEMAEEAIKSTLWDSNLNIWGTQMIKLTQLKSEYGINSPVKCTSARINIHLFRQAFYDYNGKVSEMTEDEWID